MISSLNLQPNRSIIVATMVAFSAGAVFLISNRRTRIKKPLIKPQLRNVTPFPGEPSKIVYLTGIDKQTSECELLGLFSKGGSHPVEMDLSEVAFHKGGGRAWALFYSADDAKNCVDVLNQTLFRGCTLCARLELGVKQDGMRVADNATHTAILRSIQTRRGTPKKSKPPSHHISKERKKQKKEKMAQICSIDQPVVSYSHKSISVGQTEYPFPSGVYMAKLIQMMCTASSGNNGQSDINQQEDVALLQLLANVTKLGGGSVHKYTKELSEAFAMVDAIERGIKHIFGVATKHLDRIHPSVICYCLGDGKYPVGAAALALAMPKGWEFVAIDPLLNSSDSVATDGPFCHDRIEAVSGFSQDYSIHQDRSRNYDDNATTRRAPLLTIVVACHSHAPLEEFWERIPPPKLCASMPCCAQYSELPKESPILEYDNFEVYSPKRRIKIFAAT
jgi:hypothetical protein